MAVALISPVDGLGEELLSAHMAQHLLIADLAVPLLLAGLRARSFCSTCRVLLWSRSRADGRFAASSRP